MKDSQLTVIFKGNPVEAEMIKNMLVEHGIRAILKNQLMGSIAPWHVSPGGFDPVEVEILANNKEEALKLIEEFNAGTD